MPSKKYLELKEFTDVELNNELEVSITQYNKLKFDHAVKGLDNPLTLREVRRDIARLQTELKRREIDALDQEGLANRSKRRARRKSN